MPDIDPSALQSRPSISTTPIPPPKKLELGASATKAVKVSSAVPQRLDIEPLYTSLKAAVGDNWSNYKDAVGLFVMGQLNQAELSARVDWFLTSFTGETEHMHNQLMAAIYGNVTREMPDQTVAIWVSANDKPTSGPGSKPVSGDAAEQRIKVETMNLHSRDRRRIKDIALNDIDAYDPYVSLLGEHRKTKIPKLAHELVPQSAGGLNNLHKTNWDSEIKKRFAQPLAAESGEFPDTSSIEARMLPICYENGLVSGHNADAAQFMSVATETFIKQFLSSVFDKTRSNGPGAGGSAGSGGGASWITTHKYRKQLEKEEELWLRGEIQRDKSGLLPSEAKAAGERGPLGLADLRMALELGDCGIGQMPVVLDSIMYGYREGELEGWDEYYMPNFAGLVLCEVGMDEDIIMNGMANYANDVKPKNESYMDHDLAEMDDWGWEGAGLDDREALNSVLDSCLAV